MNVFEEVEKIRIVPVVVLNDVTKAIPLAEALTKGGLPCAEVTFRTCTSIVKHTLPQDKIGEMNLL